MILPETSFQSIQDKLKRRHKDLQIGPRYSKGSHTLEVKSSDDETRVEYCEYGPLNLAMKRQIAHFTRSGAQVNLYRRHQIHYNPLQAHQYNYFPFLTESLTHSLYEVPRTELPESIQQYTASSSIPGFTQYILLIPNYPEDTQVQTTYTVYYGDEGRPFAHEMQLCHYSLQDKERVYMQELAKPSLGQIPTQVPIDSHRQVPLVHDLHLPPQLTYTFMLNIAMQINDGNLPTPFSFQQGLIWTNEGHLYTNN